MSDFLLNAGRQTLMLELQEASRLPERLGDDFVRAANTIIQCESCQRIFYYVPPAAKPDDAASTTPDAPPAS